MGVAEDPADALLQRALGPGLGGGQLPVTGVSPVVGFDAGRGPPDRDVADQVAVVLAGSVTRDVDERAGPGWRFGGRPACGLIADDGGLGAHVVGGCGQVGTPLRVVLEGLGDGGQPWQRATDGQFMVGAGGETQSPVEHRGGVAGVGEGAAAVAGLGDGPGQQLVGFCTGDGAQREVHAQRRVGGEVGQVWDGGVGGPVDRGHAVRSEGRGGRGGERVEVEVGGVVQGAGRVGEVLGGAGRGHGCVVASQDAGEHVDGGGRQQCLSGDDGVRVAVAGGGEVDVVAAAAAGHGDVEQLAGFLAGGHGVAGVGGDALSGVDGGGVAQLDVVGDVGGGQCDVSLRPQVGHLQRAGFEHGVDGPAVAVLDPVGGGDGDGAVVLAADDRVPGRAGQPVGELHGGLAGGVDGDAVGRRFGESVGACAGVQLGDEVAGGGQHDRVAAGGAVVAPGVVGVIGAGGEVADVDALLVEVVAQRGGVAVAQRERGGSFCVVGCPCGRVSYGVGEPHDLGQRDRALAGSDVAQHPACADRGELLVVADQTNRPAPGQHERDRLVQVRGAGHAGFVDHDERVGADGGEPVAPAGEVRSVGDLGVAAGREPGLGGRVEVRAGLLGLGPFGERDVEPGAGSVEAVRVGRGEVDDQLGQGVGLGADFFAQHRGGCGRGGETDDVAAGGGPGAGQHPHGGGLAGAGGGERELDAGTGGGQLAHQLHLTGVERHLVGYRFQQRDVDLGFGEGASAALRRGGQDCLLGLHDGGRGVEPGTGDGVDRAAVGAAQHGWGVCAGGGFVCVQRQRQAWAECGLHDLVDGAVDVDAADVGGPHTPFGLGADVVLLPHGALALHPADASSVRAALPEQDFLGDALHSTVGEPHAALASHPRRVQGGTEVAAQRDLAA